MSIVFRTEDGQAIKTWVNVEYDRRGVPMAGDIVVLHWGDYNEESERYTVLRRVFDGTRTESVDIIVKRYEEPET